MLRILKISLLIAVFFTGFANGEGMDLVSGQGKTISSKTTDKKGTITFKLMTIDGRLQWMPSEHVIRKDTRTKVVIVNDIPEIKGLVVPGLIDQMQLMPMSTTHFSIRTNKTGTYKVEDPTDASDVAAQLKVID